MKKNVASQTVCAQMIIATTGAAFTSAVTVSVTGDGGTQATGSVGSGACTHEGNGYHSYAPAQAETNYDHVAFTFTGSGAIPATVQIYTTFPQTGDNFARLGAPAGASVSADVAAIHAKTTNLPSDPADASVIAGRFDTLDTSISTVDTVVDAIKLKTDNLPSDPADASVIAARFDTLDTSVADLPTNAELATSQAAADDATLAAIATLQTSVNDVPTNAELATALASADDATLAAIAALNNLSTAQVNAEVDTALADIHLDHLLAVTYDPASKPGAADALLNELVESDGGVARYTANALEQAPTGGSAPTAADIADAVWDEAIAGHLTAGSTGAALNSAGSAGDPWGTALPGAYGAGTAGKIVGDNLNATVSSRATQTSVDDLPTNAELATALASADDATLAAIDNLPTNAELATALGTADDATLAAIATLQTSVNDLPTNAELATALASADDATLAAINDLPTNAELATALATADDATLAAIAALNNLSAAQVNAEVVDALATDTYAEPTGVPAATASLAAKIGRLHQALRNKVSVTATKKQFFDDSSVALWEKDLSDSGTEYIETEGNSP